MHWTVTFAITLLGGFGLTANAAEDSELQPILNSFIIEYDSVRRPLSSPLFHT